MPAFFTLRSKSKNVAVRIAEGVVFITLGWLLSTGLSTLRELGGFTYTANSYYEVALHEWKLVALPIFLFFAPSCFLSLMVIFQRISWIKLTFFAISAGFILTIPSFTSNMRRWQVVFEFTKDIPTTKSTYFRWNGGFPAGVGMSASFSLSEESYQKIDQTMQERMPHLTRELSQNLLLGHGFNSHTVRFYIEKQTKNGRRLSPTYNYGEFISSEGEIIGTLDIRSP